MQKHTLLIVLLLLVTNSWSQDFKKILIKAYTSSDSSDYYFQVAKKIIKTPADEGEFYFCKNARHVDYGSSDSAVYYGKIAIDKLKKVNNFIACSRYITIFQRRITKKVNMMKLLK